MVLEVVAGLLSGSLALLADAGHMLTDSASLALALFAVMVSRRPADERRTYGYGRMRWWGYPESAAIRYQHLLLDAIAQPGPLDAKLDGFFARYPDPRAVE